MESFNTAVTPAALPEAPSLGAAALAGSRIATGGAAWLVYGVAFMLIHAIVSPD